MSEMEWSRHESPEGKMRHNKIDRQESRRNRRNMTRQENDEKRMEGKTNAKIKLTLFNQHHELMRRSDGDTDILKYFEKQKDENRKTRQTK